jgi:tetratricopeptide (TPR) repeat protein
MHSRHVVLDAGQLGVAASELGLDDVGGPRSAYLLRPFLDLTPFGPGSTDTSTVECAFRQLADGSCPRLMIQNHPAPNLRPALIREIGLPAYRVRYAADLPPRLRTPRWQYLADTVAAAERPRGLSAERQLRLATLLNTLGLYHETARLFGPAADGQPAAGPATTALRIRHAMAVQRTERSARAAELNLRVLREAAEDPRGEPHVRLGAAITLLVIFAKGRKHDLGQVRYWREVAERVYPRLAPDGMPDVLYASAYWRAVSYTRYLAGDQAGTAAELDEAERYAELFRPRDEIERMLWGQNMHPLLETRGREAFDAGDLPLARQRIGKLAALDPLHPKVHVHVGNIELADGEPEKALAAFRAAVDLGAPWTSFAWFMAGHCQELIGDGRGAAQAYLQAVMADPGSIDARRRLAALAGSHGGDLRFLADWAGTSLTTITRRLRGAPGQQAKAKARATEGAAA